ncbi:hypothetical protein RF11_03035 [Thelohanellus kitauei]|uniref:Alpha-soluble NSF attachment protein n=1 Tax=Thelohanellus kitauei TaxID=669202 RepID=A0A0C2MXC5_THEKT|nr:hypothetical protein RF11_03035 [Thelohanellus kitauei]
MNELIMEIKILSANATKSKYAQMFEEAGKAYYDIARRKEVYLRLYDEALAHYEEAARCYIQIKSSSAMDCYHRIIGIMVKDYRIDLAIYLCFEYGYTCRTIFGDLEKMEEFYKKGEEIRIEYQILHKCVRTKSDLAKYKKDKKKALSDYERVF